MIQKISQFNIKLGERAGLIIPAAFVLTSLVYILIYPTSTIKSQPEVFLTELFFNGGIHFLITGYLIFFVGEYNKYLTDKSVQIKKSFLIILTALFLFYVLIFSILNFYNKTNANFVVSILVGVVALINVFYGIHHEISQSYGLSFLQYSQYCADSNEPLNSSQVRNAIKLERLIIPVVIGTSLVKIISFQLFEQQVATQITFFTVFIIFIYMIYLNYSLKSFSTGFRNKRALFSVRYLLMPMGTLSIAAAIGRVVTHRFEYYQIFQKSIHNSQKSSFTVKNIFLFGCLLIVVFIAYGNSYTKILLNTFSGKNLDLTWFDLLVTSLFTSLGFTHYYIDRVIFKFSDPIVRNNQAKILLAHQKID